VIPVNTTIIFNTYSLLFNTFALLFISYQIKFYSVDANISLFCKPNCNSVKPGKSLAGSVLEHNIESECNSGFEIKQQAMLHGFTHYNESYSF
jgi:hypothetical protein